jgi:hypothetical protein
LPNPPIRIRFAVITSYSVISFFLATVVNRETALMRRYVAGEAPEPATLAAKK